MVKSKGGRPRIPKITPDLGDLEDKLPKKEVDYDAVLHWMDLGATQEEIAGSFRISVDTLSRRLKSKFDMTFAELKEKVCGSAKIALRRNQFNLSKTNATMGIWLGKNWLGQRDDPQGNESFNGELKDSIESLKKMYTDSPKESKKENIKETNQEEVILPSHDNV